MQKEKVLTSPRIKEVTFLTNAYLCSLEDSINEAIKTGWELYGEIKMAPAGGYFIMMIRYEEAT